MYATDRIGNKYEKQKLIPNDSEFYCGPSGTGKTTVLIRREIEFAKAGKRVLSLAFHGAGDRDLIDSKLRRKYEASLKTVFVKAGLSLPYMETGGRRQDIELSRILGKAFGLAPTYVECVEAAIRKAIEYGDFAEKGLNSVLDNLCLIDTAAARQAYVKLAPLISCVPISNGDFLTDSAITELNFDGIQLDDQIRAAEFVLNVILQAAENDRFLPGGIVIVLDELQKISAEKDSAFRNLLEVGRKKGVSFLLSSPEFPLGRKSVSAFAAQQCGLVAYFRPGPMDTRRIARELAPREVADCCITLNRLQRGEFVVAGGLEMVGGGPIHRAIALHIPDIENEEKLSRTEADSRVEKIEDKVKIMTGNRGKCVYN